MKRFLGRVAAWCSQTVNLFMLFGHHDQTVSARVHVNRHKPGWRKARKIINGIFFWQMDHCLFSFESDVRFAKEVLAFRR